MTARGYSKRPLILFLLAIFLPCLGLGATANIMVTGFWPPTNEMLLRFSADARINPQGWLGKNWKNSGYDIYAFFPHFSPNDPSVGEGDFRVDFAATYNDFFKYTDLLRPVAILSFGNGPGWRLEKNYPAYFETMFRTGKIPSTIGVATQYEVPETLKSPAAHQSTLPLQKIKDAINKLKLPSIEAYINEDGDGGNYLCGFMGYLESWYQTQHSDPADPFYTAMAGFTHVESRQAQEAILATETTFDVVVQALHKIANAAH